MSKKLNPSRNLAPAAKKIFRKLAPNLIADDRLKEDNVLVFEILCQEIATYFSIEVDPDKMIVNGQNGSKVINPLIRERRNIVQTITALAKEFGMTPKGLHSLGMLTKGDEKPKDPVSDMMMKRAKMKVV